MYVDCIHARMHRTTYILLHTDMYIRVCYQHSAMYVFEYTSDRQDTNVMVVMYSQTSLVSTPGDPPNCYSLSVVLANHNSIMAYKLGYHILVLPNQVLLVNGVLTNEVLLYVSYMGYIERNGCT